MARVKNGAKGYFGSKHRLYKTAKEQLMHSGQYAFRDRKQKKRDFRKLWITRINAACRQNDISYSRFIEGLTKAGVEINPKMFSEIVKTAKEGKEGKLTKATEVIGREVTINGAKETKTTKEKKEVKVEAKEKSADVDYSKMTVAELKEIATEKNINVAGMKKAEIIEALTK